METTLRLLTFPYLQFLSWEMLLKIYSKFATIFLLLLLSIRKHNLIIRIRFCGDQLSIVLRGGLWVCYNQDCIFVVVVNFSDSTNKFEKPLRGFYQGWWSSKTSDTGNKRILCFAMQNSISGGTKLNLLRKVSSIFDCCLLVRFWLLSPVYPPEIYLLRIPLVLVLSSSLHTSICLLG